MGNHTIIVDDLRTPNHAFRASSGSQVHTCTTAPAGIALLNTIREQREHVDCLYLDHDLGETTPRQLDGVWVSRTQTIMPLLDAILYAELSGNPYEIKHIVIHTANPVGRDTMVRAFSSLRVSPAFTVTTVDAGHVGLAYQS
jgi:hypothetical protein